MSNTNYFNLYLSNTILLARSLNIKLDMVINSMNSLVESIIASNVTTVSIPYSASDPTTWKYYYNVCGLYYEPVDSPIYIISIDSGQQIKFDAPTLVTNPLTKKNYQIGSVYYNKLIAQYPTYQYLIDMILNPATSMTVAINAANGTILNYNQSLVDTNEYYLISDLQKWVTKCINRWVIADMAFSDSLYPATIIAILYSNIPTKLMNIRLKYARTLYANSFHIEQYFRSHNNIYAQLDMLPNSIIMYLYKNLILLERNSGTQENLDLIITNILNKLGIPLLQYTLLEDGFNADGSKNIVIKEENHPASTITVQPSLVPVTTVLNEESALYDNDTYLTNNQSVILNNLQLLRVGSMLTKIIKISNTDNIYLADENFSTMALSYWPGLANLGLYTTPVTFTGKDTSVAYTLSPLDAYVYYLYLIALTANIEITIVPTAYVAKIPITPIKTLSEFSSYFTPNIVPDTTLLNYLYQQIIAPRTIIDSTDFYNYMTLVYQGLINVEFVQQTVSNCDFESQLQLAMDSLYVDTVIQFPYSGINIYNWLEDRSLPILSQSSADLYIIIQNLLQAVLGFSISTTSLLSQQIQAINTLLANLVSYNTQILDTSIDNLHKYIIMEKYGVVSNSYSITENGVINTYNTSLADYNEYGYIGHQHYQQLTSEQQAAITSIY